METAVRAFFGLKPFARMHGPKVSDCGAEIVSAKAIRAICPTQWDGLVANALEDNPYLSRQTVLAGFDALGEEAGMQALVARQPGDGRMIGFFPFRKTSIAPGLPISQANLALNLYQVHGAPLIDRDHADTALSAFLNHCRRGQAVPARWTFPHMDFSGPFATRLAGLAKTMGLAITRVRAYERPCLRRTDGGFETHIETVVGKKRAKDIERNLRRLGEHGAVTFERVSDPQKVRQRVEDFLALEHAGWKGRKGTSLLSDPAHARFSRLAFGGEGAQGGQAVVDSLLLDGAPIAISINMAAGDTFFTAKCAFDETYRKFGPGLALEYLVIKAFFEREDCAEMDAATTVDGHVISNLWNGSKPMGMMVVGPDDWQTRLIVRIEQTEHNLRRFAKSLLRRA